MELPYNLNDFYFVILKRSRLLQGSIGKFELQTPIT